MGNYTRLTIFTDGASRLNPGPASAGIHIVDETTLKTVVELRIRLGIATNNEAEYQAVLHAVTWLLVHRDLLADDIQLNFLSDSRLVVEQLNGRWNVKDPNLLVLVGEVRKHLCQLPGTQGFTWIPREQNAYADKLANDALDNGV